MLKYFLPLLLVVNGLLLPLGCLPFIALTNPYNPIQIAFITDIHFTNATDESLKVTPVGAVGPHGDRFPLPVYRQRSSAYVSSQRGGFLVGPGATIEILYGWDDVNLAEIVVENMAGDVRQVVADPNPTVNQYRIPSPNAFTLTDFHSLSPVSPPTLSAFREAHSTFSVWPGLLPFLFPWFTFTVLTVIVIRRKRGVVGESWGSVHRKGAGA